MRSVITSFGRGVNMSCWSERLRSLTCGAINAGIHSPERRRTFKCECPGQSTRRNDPYGFMLRSQVVNYFGDYLERSALSSLIGRFPRCRQQELTWIPALEPQCENPITAISPQLFLRGIIRSFDWFVSGEKNESRSPAEHPPLQNVIVRNLLPSVTD